MHQRCGVGGEANAKPDSMEPWRKRGRANSEPHNESENSRRVI